MNDLLFRAADFLSRPPGFYLVLVALVVCTALVPLGMTDLVTYVLSVAAIIITGVASFRATETQRRSTPSWTRSSSRWARLETTLSALSTRTRKKSKPQLNSWSMKRKRSKAPRKR